MSAWAYRCHPCVEGEADWFVSQSRLVLLLAGIPIDKMPWKPYAVG